MADLSLDLCGVKLKNPIIAASGTFGFGREYDELYDIGRLGGISVKGLSLLPRTGNPPSRIAETPSGMLNSVGLQNPGVESFIENDLPWLLTKDVAVIANITGTSVEQYVQMAERLAGTGVHLLEMNISLDLCGVKLKNPIIAASGTFGFGREYDELYDIGRLGGISVKGLSLLPRTGNPPSRIAETPSGMLNSVGLQNPGVESFIENDLPWLLTKDVAVIANITGTSVEQYVQMAERLAGTGVHLLEMNISCPNVHEGGVAFGVKPESVYAITKAVKAAAKQPLIVKLTPNVSDITENALAAEEAGADAISMINTLTGIAVDVNKRKMVLANNTGGLSGPAVRPVALRMVWQSAKKVHIPIIGMGGIETGEDAAAFMLCGAKAVMVGTANFTDPFACPRIIRELDAYCDRQKVQRAQELVGTLKEY